MPQADRPNPSFYVLTLDDPDARKRVNDQILGFVEGEKGQNLTPLGDNDYVLARPAAKQLLIGRTGDEVINLLNSLDGVADATHQSSDNIRSCYENRTAVPSSPRPVEKATAARAQDEQWNLEFVQAQRAWAMFPSGPPNASWRQTRVGHIDTGYTEHPVLGFKADHRSDFVRAHEGINHMDSGGLPLDPLDYDGQPGHGTRTMSVLCGNLPGTFLGIAPGVTVVPYRLTNSVVIDTLGNVTELDRAIHHAVFDAGCDVISISLGDPCFPPTRVGEQVDAAYEGGVIIVAAAGNITSEVTYPGRYERTIAAGGVTRDGEPWSGGARGSRVDICAPADEIFRATAELQDESPTYGYGPDGDGTSYATVHVSAAAALWSAFHGRSLDLYGRTWRRVEAFRQALARSANRPADWNANLFGAGILDVARLLEERLPDPSTLKKSEIPAAREKH